MEPNPVKPEIIELMKILYELYPDEGVSMHYRFQTIFFVKTYIPKPILFNTGTIVRNYNADAKADYNDCIFAMIKKFIAKLEIDVRIKIYEDKFVKFIKKMLINDYNDINIFITCRAVHGVDPSLFNYLFTNKILCYLKVNLELIMKYYIYDEKRLEKKLLLIKEAHEKVELRWTWLGLMFL